MPSPAGEPGPGRITRSDLPRKESEWHARHKEPTTLHEQQYRNGARRLSVSAADTWPLTPVFHTPRNSSSLSPK